MFEQAVLAKEESKEQIKKYPGCNSQFKTGEGGKVWCGNEELVPRKGQMVRACVRAYACACVRVCVRTRVRAYACACVCAPVSRMLCCLLA